MGHGACENWCISTLWSLENYFGRKMKGFLKYPSPLRTLRVLF